MINPPDICDFSEQALLQEIQALVPQYTPEWRFTPEDADAGSALFLTFIRMFSGNLRRFNQVPYRNLLSYLNLLGVDVRSARPATAYVCLSSTKTKGDTYVPKGTVFTSTISGEDGLALSFESEMAIQVSSNQLQSMVIVNGAEDTISQVELPESGTAFSKPLDVFQSLQNNNLQKHVFYIGARSLFQCRGGIEIRLFFHNSYARYLEPVVINALASPDVVWSYWNGDDWQPFDEVTDDASVLVLRKYTSGDIGVIEDMDASMRWIRCEVRPGSIRDMMSRSEHYAIDAVECQVNHIQVEDEPELLPDFQFCNNLEPDGAGYHPFGERFSVYNMWYIANDEVLTKRHAEIELTFYLAFRDIVQGREPKLNVRWRPIMRGSQFDMPPTPRLHIRHVVWEYFNGSTWVRLDVDAEATELFHTGAGDVVRVRFVCPADLTPTSVKSRHCHWIRARVLSMDMGYGAYNIFVSPWVDHIRFNYRYTTARVQPDLLRADNNLVRSELTWSGQKAKPVPLFESLDASGKVLYLGFSDPFENGPFSLYWSLRDGGMAEPNAVRWSYLAHHAGEEVWTSLQTMDDTGGLRHSGTIRFMISTPMAKVRQFNQTMYWIRCEMKDADARAARVVLAGIYLNAVRAIQLARVQQESPQSTVIDGSAAYAVGHGSLLEEAVWVDETQGLTPSQLHEIADDCKQTIQDAGGHIVRAWIKWSPVQSFLMSTPLDRHYMVDRHRGIFYFGDGTQGRVPPASMTGVRVHYAYGGGSLGNVPAGTIDTLKNAIPYIKDVYNPDAAYGGQDLESTDAAVRRGLQLPAHQNRAITSADFESLAIEATTLVREAKAIANVGIGLRQEPGSLLLVVLPIESGYPSFASAQTAIEDYLRDKAVNMLQTHRNLYISQPQYVRVSSHVRLVVLDMDVAITVQMEAQQRLLEFLDTYTGGLHGQGWHIGEFVHLTTIHGLLKPIPKVHLVDRVTLEAELLTPDGATEIRPEDAARLQHVVVTGGRHTVDVVLANEGANERA